jgi:hypothetical protein
MPLPNSVLQLAIYALLVVPGISFATMRAWVAGVKASDRSVGARILEATFISIIFDSIYGVVLLGVTGWDSPEQGSNFVGEHPFVSSIIAATAFLLIPAVISFFAYANITWRRSKIAHIPYPELNTAFTSIPTAWDSVASNLSSGKFVRIRMDEGTWVGGWFSTKSFMSTYPENRDLFIEAQYTMTSTGEFGGRVNGTAGVWVSAPEGVIVEWVDPVERKA